MEQDPDRIEALRAAIVAQADAAGPAGWLSIPVQAVVHRSGRLRVPRGAFEHWCVWRAGGEHLATPWRRVSPQGVKQGADDPYHTDWLLGAGLSPRDSLHDSGDHIRIASLNEAVYAARSEIEARLLGHGCSILLNGPDVEGASWHPRSPADDPPNEHPLVAVLRDARPDWLDVVSRVLDGGGAVVVERGGEMAHLVTVLRRSGVGPVVRVDDARKLFPEGTRVEVAPSRGAVELRDDGRAPAPGLDLGDYPVPRAAEPIPADVVETPPPGKTFDLRRCGKDNPADRAPYMLMERAYKVEGADHWALGSLSADSRDTEYVELSVRVHSREPFAVVANFYAGRGKWPFADVKAATLQAFHMFEPAPDPDRYFKEREAARARRLKAFRDKVHAMTDAEIAAYMADKVAGVDSFNAGLRESRYDLADIVDIEEDFDVTFREVGLVLEERGLPPVPMPSILTEEELSAPRP